MHLGLQRDPEMEPKRAKTLFISICIHIFIFAFLLLNPDLLTQMPKRYIRIAGQDYDLSKNQMTELLMPPQQRAKPQVPEKPLVQPPQPKPEPQQQQQQPPPPPPQQQPPPPPPPPPPPQQKESPPITPDMVLKEGARPDGTPKPSQGNTAELKTGSSGSPDPKNAGGPKSEPKNDPPQQMARNMPPDPLSLRDLAGKIIQQESQQPRRFPGNGDQGPRTGIQNPNIQENPDFSTEEPKILSPTYGYDFGPYLNQVINKIRVSWYSLIPEIAKFKRARVVIIFTIQKNGVVAQPNIVAPSGTDPLDRAAFGSITLSNPFPPMPANFQGDHLTLQITYLYNINP